MEITKEEIIRRYIAKGLRVLNVKDCKTNKTKLTSVDNDGYKYYFNLNGLNKFTGNVKSKFSKSNPYIQDNIRLYFKQHDIEAELLRIEADNEGRKILVLRCECGSEYRLELSTILGRNPYYYCDKCKPFKAVSRKKYKFEFVKSTLEDNGYILLDNYYGGNNESLNCLDAEGYRVKVKFTHVLNRYNKKPLRFSIVSNEVNYLYNINHYFKLNNIDCKAIYYKKVDGSDYPKIICRCSCGNEFETNFGGIKDGQYRCKKCSHSISKIEQKIGIWLDSKHIAYEAQKKFDDCKDIRCLPFDYYLPKYNMCIEVDGDQHHTFVPFGNESIDEQKKALAIRQKHDKIKSDYCATHGIKLLRINQCDIERNHKEYKKILYENLIKK